ncbi:MAG: hypothetical protein AAF243_17440 [Cyanobacteria bacterium P01_A01_bin.137]
MEIDWEILKAHFLEADSATQLNSLAMNLTRIQLFTSSNVGEPTVKHLIRESQFFIEWIVTDLNLEVHLNQAVELTDLQRLLSRWKLSNWWGDEQTRQDVAKQAGEWCYLIRQQSRTLRQRPLSV